MNAPHAKYRSRLPQLTDRTFITDGGLETTLIFQEGVDLPLFAAFPLLDDAAGLARIHAYFEGYCQLAREAGAGFVLESPTWRANPEWARRLGYDLRMLAAVNRKAIALMVEMRDRFETAQSPMPISGNIGPRGDGYVPSALMTAAQAEDYHGEQVAVFRDSAADMVSGFTLNYVEEALGVARAAKAAGMPSVIAFTVETDGRLPSGQSLKDAITQVDEETGASPVYYMVNCAHPTHFSGALAGDESWTQRIRGIRANASRCSHAELDAMTDVDIGDPVEFGRQYADLRRRFRQINVLGGCCGTDLRHLEQIRFACLPVAA